MPPTRLIPFTLGLVLLLCPAVHAAPVGAPPDAGETLREVQPEPALKAPEPGPPPPIETEEEGAKPSNNDMKVVVKSVRITGNSEVSLEELNALVAGLPGGERSLGDLRAAAARITIYYRQHGYAVARAYLPSQDIKDGVVTISIIEGRIGNIHLDNQSRLLDESADAYLDRLKQGGAIKSAEMDRGLLLLDDTPGVGGSRAALQPGASVGTSELLVALSPAATYSGSASVDNYGNRYTGEYRAGGNFNVNSPLRIGDLLTLGVLASGQHLQYGRIAYQLPIGGDGLRVGFALFDVHYKLGKEFKPLESHGDARSASMFIVYSFIRSLQGNLTGTATWEEKSLEDDIDSIASAIGKRVHLVNLGLSGNYRDAFAGGGISSLDLSFALGRLDINSYIARLIDDASAGTRGDYARLSYSASRFQHITETTTLLLALSGQVASKNLDSSEQFQLGGSDGVRAYPQGEGIGDEGYLIKLELRHNFAEGLGAIAFYDGGSVNYAKTPFAFGPNRRDLAGVGFGINAALNGFELKATLAWRIEGGEPNSIPTSAVHTPTALVQLNKIF
jgi:hemolysin activation/secretion protein